MREFVELANRVVPGDRSAIRWVFKVGTCVGFDEDLYVLGVGIGEDQELAADVQRAILRQFGLEELQDLFGLEVWER
ncbi:MAG TPA: hypothetical protein VHM02_03340 [Thermoanaerobaculia bacterium]|nr:hypothetical protein [Thermoanaerobaculia bacterium]